MPTLSVNRSQKPQKQYDTMMQWYSLSSPEAPAGPPDWAKGLYDKYVAAGQEQVGGVSVHLRSVKAWSKRSF